MKKILAFVLVVGLWASCAMAARYATDPPAAFQIKSLTLTSEAVSAFISCEAGTVVAYDFTARGGNIKWLGTATSATTSEYQTIISGSTIWNQMPVLVPANTAWYFVPVTANITIEAVYWYY